MRPLLEELFATQLDDLDSCVRWTGCILINNAFALKRAAYYTDQIKRDIKSAEWSRRAALSATMHLLAIDSDGESEIDLTQKRPWAEKYFAENLNALEENLHKDTNFDQSFLMRSSRHNLDVVRYYVDMLVHLAGEDATRVCRRHQISAVRHLLAFDACVRQEGAK